jgi:hypothetical protein
VFTWKIVELLCRKHFEIIADYSSSISRFNDIVNKTTLSTNQRIGKTARVVLGMFRNVLTSIQNLNRAFGTHNGNLRSGPSIVRITALEKEAQTVLESKAENGHDQENANVAE